MDERLRVGLDRLDARGLGEWFGEGQQPCTLEDECFTDGALRDGLSIFDLMVTFSSGQALTFKNVLSNLHILDYDYYFNVVDGLLAENATQPLLILDEILRKGFDGQNFIVGLSEHLRNLLVSQDSRTVQLMEVPDSIKKKYADQVYNDH